MTPDEGRPIETLKDVFASGLPWDMFEYGGVANIAAVTPEEDDLKIFWNGKQKVGYSSYIYDRVST